LANEMAIRAMLDEGQTALILNAGYFSNILKKSVEGCGATAVSMPAHECQPTNPEALRAALSQQKYDLLCFTQVETSTGLQQPVGALAKVALTA
jgi:alanine-glyoxylate transaminase/serine-glyoxylate transaminase/serine-pyruvate transaminase